MYYISIAMITPAVESLGGNRELFNSAFALLPVYRQEKIGRLKNDMDKCRSLTAGLLLNYTIGHFLSNCAADSFQEISVNQAIKSYNAAYNYSVAVSENEKPYFSEMPELFFNLSHSGNYAACIVSDKPCGIDIEGNRKIKTSVAKRFFTPKEYRWIYEASDASIQTERFLRLWTLKEAYSKMTGSGIAKEISNIEFLPGSIGSELDFAQKKKRDKLWIFQKELRGYFIAAVGKR
jgi:4'-phosphopantetheinyl transferase